MRKTHYTQRELTRRDTTQLIAIYNRLLNTNAWDEWFNPHEHRQDLLLRLYEEMAAQQIVARFAQAVEQTRERYRAMQIHITADGIFITWGKHHAPPAARRGKLTDDQVRLCRALRCEGETNSFLAELFSVTAGTMSELVSGKTYAHVT